MFTESSLQPKLGRRIGSLLLQAHRGEPKQRFHNLLETPSDIDRRIGVTLRYGPIRGGHYGFTRGGRLHEWYKQQRTRWLRPVDPLSFESHLLR